MSRSFSIGGRTTKQLPRGSRASLTVRLAGRPLVPYASIGPKHAGRLSGLLNVFEPCASPMATTVNVQMAQDQGAITISQTSIPCGTVTFVVTDTGALPDSLQVFTEFPPAKATTPELQPGQSARLTIDFAAKGTGYYESGDYPPPEPEYGGDYGEGGQLAIT